MAAAGATDEVPHRLLGITISVASAPLEIYTNQYNHAHQLLWRLHSSWMPPCYTWTFSPISILRNITSPTKHVMINILIHPLISLQKEPPPLPILILSPCNPLQDLISGLHSQKNQSWISSQQMSCFIESPALIVISKHPRTHILKNTVSYWVTISGWYMGQFKSLIPRWRQW